MRLKREEVKEEEESGIRGVGVGGVHERGDVKVKASLEAVNMVVMVVVVAMEV